MIEKRFRYVDATDEVDEHIIDYGTEPHFEYYTLKGATDKLNELHEEKEILEVQLKSANNEIDKLNTEINMLTDTCHDCCKEIRKENEQLKQQIEELEFKLRTIEAYDRTVKEDHSDTVYDFKKKLEKW